MNLKEKTTAQLTAMEESIRQEKQRREREKAEAQATECLSKLDVLLEYVVTTHGRTSCSDDNRANAMLKNGRPRCNRCFLLSCRDEEYVPLLRDFTIDVSIVAQE